MTRELDFVTLRGVAYADAVFLQRRLVADMAAHPERNGVVLCVEHAPVITCGRGGDGGNLLVSREELERAGLAYAPAGRGGDVTYHGPGQWTVYPLLRLDWFGRDLHHYLRLLEECGIEFLRRYGVEGTRRPGLTGVWAGRDKISAIGVAVSRWITWHGFAMNIDLDAGVFTRFMRPCGIAPADGGVTSLSSLLGRPVGMDSALAVLQESVAAVLGKYTL